MVVLSLSLSLSLSLLLMRLPNPNLVWVKVASNTGVVLRNPVALNGGIHNYGECGHVSKRAKSSSTRTSSETSVGGGENK